MENKKLTKIIVLFLIVIFSLSYTFPRSGRLANEQENSQLGKRAQILLKFENQKIQENGTPVIVKAIETCGKKNNVEIEKYRKCVLEKLKERKVPLQNNTKAFMVKEWINFCDSLTREAERNNLSFTQKEKEFCYLQAMIVLKMDKTKEYNIRNRDDLNWFKMAYYNDTKYCSEITDPIMRKYCYFN